MDYIWYLKKLVPNIQISRRDDFEIVIDQDIQREQKVVKILSKYFNSQKIKYVDGHTLETEAKYINKLFPTLTRHYILEQLELFKDLPHRVDIVLRLIVNSKISKVDANNLPGSSKRIIANEISYQSPEDFKYCKPIKIRKIADGNNAFYAVDNSQTATISANNYLLPPPERSDFFNTAFVKKSEVPCCTVTSVTANPQVQNHNMETTMYLSLPKEILTENLNCDSSSHIAEPSLPIMNSSVVSSSDEIFYSEIPRAMLETAISSINGPENLIKEEENEKLEDENNFIVNSSNEYTINNPAFLDFFSEIQDLSNPPSHEPEVTKEKTEIIPPTSSNKADTEDSDKTVLYEMEKDDSTNGNDVQYVNDIPSTSKKCDMPETFNLIEYLREVTSAPVAVIVRQCEKKHIKNFSIKPSLLVLEGIIDNILTNSISSEDEDNLDAVKITSEKAESASMPLVKLKTFFESTKTIENDDVPSSVTMLVPKLRKSSKLSTSSQKETESETNTQLVNYLCGIFPDACPAYVKDLCKNKPMNNEVVDQLTTVILSSDAYPKRPKVQPEPDVFPENQLEILMEFLPDADPDYLRMKCDSFEGKLDSVKGFLNHAMEHRDYPTFKDYQRRQQLSAQQKQYTTEFKVENFIKLIPDPHNFFSDSSRVVNMDALSAHYALVFLRNTFPKISVRAIQSTFNKNNLSLVATYKELHAMMTQGHLLMKSTRKAMPMPQGMQNIPLLQEIAYLSHQQEIDHYLAKIKAQEEAERQEAHSKGLMKTCNCCYDEEVLPKDIFMCEKGCSFCKNCIIKSTEVRFGEGKLDFPCLMHCDSHFTLQTLQAVLSPKLFSKIAQKKALEEIKAAGIEELEMCPFCDFATIPAAGYSIFSCLNPDCMKESCRHCKEPSHIPLKCDEIEKDEDVKARKFVEDRMTEALLKKCWKCGIKFFKEEGCNKMTCSCGASMCYVCGKPVTDYKHFNGLGGDRFELCPLYSDTNVLNKENVLKAAEQAKTEIGRELKHDPTADVDKIYKERAAKFPAQHVLAQQQREAEVYLVRLRDALLEQRQHHHHHHHRHRHHN